MATRIKVPDDWFVTIFGDEDGILKARNGKTGQSHSISGLQVPFPSPRIIGKVMQGHSVGVKDADGKTHTYKGSAASDAQAWMLYMEYLRGLLRPGRKHPVTDEAVRRVAADLTIFGRRERVGGTALTADGFDAKYAAALAAADGDKDKALANLKALLVA